MRKEDAKRSFAQACVPKYNFGTREKWWVMVVMQSRSFAGNCVPKLELGNEGKSLIFHTETQSHKGMKNCR
jgi:hypothetical protein